MIPEIEKQFSSLDNCQPFQQYNYSGIYFLCQGATVVYVGQSKNVGKRIRTHFKDPKKEFDTVL